MSELYISGRGMIPVLREMGHFLEGAEVGVCRGENLTFWMENCPNIKHVFAVDPWVEYSEQTQEQCDEFYQRTITNLKPYLECGRVSIMRDYSVNASYHIQDLSLDFVYIDGDHSFEAVFADLNAWFSKVKRGGLISGHDYGYTAVNSALEKFRDRLIIQTPIHVVDHNSWYFVKE